MYPFVSSRANPQFLANVLEPMDNLDDRHVFPVCNPKSKNKINE